MIGARPVPVIPAWRRGRRDNHGCVTAPRRAHAIPPSPIHLRAPAAAGTPVAHSGGHLARARGEGTPISHAQGAAAPATPRGRLRLDDSASTMVAVDPAAGAVRTTSNWGPLARNFFFW